MDEQTEDEVTARADAALEEQQAILWAVNKNIKKIYIPVWIVAVCAIYMALR